MTAEGVISAPLAGRDSEMAELVELVERSLKYETPQVVAVIGSVGVGKTRLLESWRELIAEAHPELRILSCRAREGGPSYSLFTTLLESRFALREANDPVEHLRAQVEEVLLDRRLTEILHFLGSFMGIEVPDNPFLRAMEEAPRQHDQIARTVLRRFLEMDAQQVPLVLLFDDVHLADEASLSLLRELAESLAGAPLVVVAASEPAIFVRHPDFLEVEAEVTRIDLGPLERGESAQLVRQLLGRVQDLPDDFVETAVEMTGGNPFFMEELVRVLLANGTIAVDGERWLLDAARADEADLPVSVDEAVHARIAALSAAERDVLEKAAVLGSVFWIEALICFSRLQREVEHKGDLWLADVEHQTIREVLDRLTERDFVLQLPDSSIAGRTEYAFKHNLERELVAKMTSGRRMQQYHLFAAQWLETGLRDRSEQQLEYIGSHYERGGNLRRAAFCYVHAGDKARARYANGQAATYYRRGLDLLQVDDVLAKIEALHNMGDVCTVLGRNDEALEHFSNMLHNAWLLDHKAKGGAAHRRIGRIYRTLGQYDRALAHLNSAMRLFDQVSDARGIAATLDDVGHVALLKGEYDRALEFHRRALATKRDIGDPRSIAVALNNIGVVHQSSGAFNDAEGCFTEALGIRREVRDRVGVVDSLANLGGMFRSRSDYARAFELWNEALELARQIGDRLDEAYLLVNLAEALVQLGNPKQAEGRINEARTLARDLGDQKLSAGCSLVLAEIKLATGDLQGAEQEARLAQETSESLGLEPEGGSALRTLGQVVAAGEVTDESREQAEQLFSRAIELFSELGNDLELARTFAAFADFNDRCGRWEDAEHFRASADDIFSRLKQGES